MYKKGWCIRLGQAGGSLHEGGVMKYLKSERNKEESGN